MSSEEREGVRHGVITHLLLEIAYGIIISIGKEMHHPGVFAFNVHLEMIHEHAPVSLGQIFRYGYTAQSVTDIP